MSRVIALTALLVLLPGCQFVKDVLIKPVATLLTTAGESIPPEVSGTPTGIAITLGLTILGNLLGSMVGDDE